MASATVDSDQENDRDSPSGSPKKWRTGRAGALWQDVAESQMLEESVSSLGIPKTDGRKKSSEKNFMEPDPGVRFAKRMRQISAGFDLPNLQKVIHRSPADIGAFRKLWAQLLRENRRCRYHQPGETVVVPALFTANKTDEPELIAKEIAWNIGEEKLDIVYNFLLKLGVQTVVDFYNKLRDIEESGGMKTIDGKRRRLAGGVFLQLVKQQIPEHKKRILDEILRDDKKINDKMALAEKKAKVRKRVQQAVSAANDREANIPSRTEVLLKKKKAEEPAEETPEIDEAKPPSKAEVESLAFPPEEPPEPGEIDEDDPMTLDLGLNIAEEMKDFM